MGACLKYFPIVTRAKEMDAAAGAFQSGPGGRSRSAFSLFFPLSLCGPLRACPRLAALAFGN